MNTIGYSFLVIGIVVVLSRMRKFYKDKFHKEGEDKYIFAVNHFPLKEAALCVQCETVFSQRFHVMCPECGSSSVYIVNLAFQNKEQLSRIAISKIKGVTIQ